MCTGFTDLCNGIRRLISSLFSWRVVQEFIGCEDCYRQDIDVVVEQFDVGLSYLRTGSGSRSSSPPSIGDYWGSV